MKKRMEVERISSGEAAFPDMLREIRNSPKELFYIGDISLLKKRCVSVIGSRTTTSYGRNTARSIGRYLGHYGICVVSGMASGIDSCAHEGALEVDGRTIAVLGCGPDICYPRVNSPLKKRIEDRGLIISEQEPGTEPMPYMFPMRNRIISGLSELTIVVQARNSSGSLITAEMAGEQGRNVCAVPGNIDSQYNLGSNKLIQEGAMPLTRVDDLGDILRIRGRQSKVKPECLSQLELNVYELIMERGELSPEELCIILGDTPQRIAPVLSVLEIKGFLCSASGKFFLANR